MLSLKLTVIFLLCCVYHASGKSCSFNMKELKTEPVILVSQNGDDFAYLEPRSHTPEIEEGTKVLLLCAGKKNKITETGKSEREAVCQNGKFVDSNGKQFTIEKSQCTSIPTAEMRETDESCADNKGVIFKAGFPYQGDQYLTLFRICYNTDTKTVYWTNNIVHGRSLAFCLSESKRKPFSAEGMGASTTKINKFYKTESQITTFNSIFGAGQDYVSKQNFIARGHLVPDADGCFRPQQFGTYFYMNAQPQYQLCNAGNWLRVESGVRNIAQKLNTDLDVYTGVFGELKFKDAKGRMTAAYIDDKKQLSVPEYFFKVVKDLKTGASIVFIASNNPLATNIKPFCNNICEKQNVAHPDFSRQDRGFAFCCTLTEFLKHYEYLPKSCTDHNNKVLGL